MIRLSNMYRIHYKKYMEKHFKVDVTYSESHVRELDSPTFVIQYHLES